MSYVHNEYRLKPRLGLLLQTLDSSTLEGAAVKVWRTEHGSGSEDC